jgi:hypothetical protein
VAAAAPTQTKAVSYAFGYLQPLPLDVITELLTDQCRRGYAAFDAFQELIMEHEASIVEYERRSAGGA